MTASPVGSESEPFERARQRWLRRCRDLGLPQSDEFADRWFDLEPTRIARAIDAGFTSAGQAVRWVPLGAEASEAEAIDDALGWAEPAEVSRDAGEQTRIHALALLRLGLSGDALATAVRAEADIDTVAAWVDERGSTAETIGWMLLGVGRSEVPKWEAAGIALSEAKGWVLRGFPLSTALKWRSLRFTASEAKAWRSRGFSLEDASEPSRRALGPAGAAEERARVERLRIIVEGGATGEAVEQWAASDIPTAEIGGWVRGVHTLADAEQWRPTGIKPWVVSKWQALGFTPASAAPWAVAGISPIEAARRAGQGLQPPEVA